MHLSVKLLNGDKLEFDVPENSCTVGRSAKCQVVIAHEGVSRQHCTIEYSGVEFYVTDLASTNGVMIDGQKIPPNVRTEFKAFLPLSFGPVQSLLVSTDDEMTRSNLQNPFLKGGFATDSTIAAATKVMKENKPQPPLKVAQPVSGGVVKAGPPRKKSKIDPKMIFAVIMAIAILYGAYYFQSMKGEGGESAPAESSKPTGPVEYY